MTKHAYGCLVEACRRYSHFHLNCPITKAWTGLGTASEYRDAVKAGFMELATQANPGHLTWWRLTPLGAGIVLAWLGAGFTHEKIQNGLLPPMPFEIRKPKHPTCGGVSCN